MYESEAFKARNLGVSRHFYWSEGFPGFRKAQAFFKDLGSGSLDKS